jgi:hypothetical protein
MTPSTHTYPGWIKKGLAVLAAMCSVTGTPQIGSHALAAEEYRSYPSPDGRFKIVVHRIPKPSAVPGQSGDAAGYVRLIDTKSGRTLEQIDIAMVQLANSNTITWTANQVSIKLIANWKLPEQTTIAADASALPPEWIHSRVTLGEIEGPDRAPDLIKPADTPAWRAFKDKLERHDELWYFTSAPESFGHGAGRMGYVILRNGKQVAHFIAIMN